MTFIRHSATSAGPGLVPGREGGLDDIPCPSPGLRCGGVYHKGAEGRGSQAQGHLG